MSTVPIVIMALQKKYIRIFKRAQAFSPRHSILLSNHGITKSMIFNRLIRQGIIVPTGNDRYYLDEERENTLRNKRQAILFVIFLVLIIFMFIVFSVNR